MSASTHAPYAPKTQSLGETPTVSTDVPILAILLVIYLVGGISHMRLFLKNKKAGHFFMLNAMTFGFCNVRVVTMILRMSWSTQVHNVRLAMASGIFVYMGTVLLYAINLVFTQRVIRAQHPSIGWSKSLAIFFKACYAWIIITVAILIVAIIQQFYTLSTHIHHIDRALSLYGQTSYAILAFLPIPLVIISTLVSNLPSTKAARAQQDRRVDKFGTGSMTTKITLILASGAILFLGACFRLVINFLPPVSLAAPHPWYFSKACFYLLNFGVEVVVVYTWLLVRVDQRFHVPNKAQGRYDYQAYLASRAKGGDLEKGVAEGPLSDSETESLAVEKPAAAIVRQ